MIEHRMKCRHFIEALSGEYAFPEEVLICVRDCARVDIESRLPGVDSGQTRTGSRANRDADAGLKNAIAFCHDTAPRINDRLIQRMSHRANQCSSCPRRKLRVSIQRQYISHMLQHFCGSGLYRKGIAPLDQKIVQLKQFAALALPSHPDALPAIEDTMTVEKQKRALLYGSVAAIELINELNGKLYQWITVIPPRGGDRVRQICQQGKMQMSIPIGQEPHFKISHKLTYLRLVQQQGRHRNQSRAVVRDSAAEIKPGQTLWTKQRSDGQIDQLYAVLCGRQQ